ncbi:MAG TPA: amino acid ABC transporter substrate-binding protein [Sphingomicrobium sp.]|jgi:ABC-type amino acid transport substrate-binding protein|nr:amino acid ABC transporter substrate-binding protein [Sphingomicrobium sp.]
MKSRWLLGYCAAAAVVLSGTAHAATIDRLRQDNTLRIAYRLDAPPFSYQDGTAKPTGFVVSLCQAVVKRLSQQLSLPSLQVSYVPVTASDRFDAIQQGKADLLCEATTVTMSRRKIVDFSVDTFIDGAGLLITADGPRNLRAMADRPIGVLAGTTTEQALRKTLADAGINAKVTPATTHAEGLALLDSGKISAYFADRSILWVLQANSKAPSQLRLADEYLTVEPYALGLPRGDNDFRFEVDRALSEIYRSGEIADVLARTFGGGFRLGPELQSLYLMSAIPD